ncbi:MAG: Alpha-amylase [Promethearchaeota archaeon]|nr:MAG: Alpha-amylase [Candidatus Lokiarchaeota archaeon]
MQMNNEQTKWKNHSNLFEINTWPWLTELSEHYDRKIILDNIPEEIFEGYLQYFDVVWLMGVWERSPASKRIAQEEPDLQKAYQEALDHVKEEDIIGSPYAVYYYHVDKNLGGKESLLKFREQLLARNIKLILDYVPNHVARDHMWTLEKSDIFIEGTFEDMNSQPDNYFSSYGRVLAHGKDPYFLPWTDTVQINAFSSEARTKAINTLKSIADICDGVRCDMAMLVTNKIFKKTWGDKAGDPPETEFWERVIPSVRENHPDFKFIGEVYWDMEYDLMQQGFDYCYDKRLYDRILKKNVEEITAHLNADYNYQKKLVRFLENHDEIRVAKELGINLSKAAAMVILTLPGMGLIYEGQMKGYTRKVPVQLKRRGEEETDLDLLTFYRNLLILIQQNQIKTKYWEKCTSKGQENNSGQKIISHHWWDDQNHFLIVVNFDDSETQTHISIPSLDYNTDRLSFYNISNENKLVYQASEIKETGLKVELEAWKGIIYEISTA